MTILKYILIFTLVFAVLSIVLVQNGETRYYTSLRSVFNTVSHEFDFDFYHLKTSLDQLEDVFSRMQKTFDKNFSENSYSTYPGIPGSSSNSSLVPTIPKPSWMEDESPVEKIWRYIKSLFTFLIEFLPLVFELTINLVFFLIALIGDGLSFVRALFSVFWTLLFPASLP